MGVYKKHNYLNKDIPYFIGQVYEYDVVSCGFNILRKELESYFDRDFNTESVSDPLNIQKMNFKQFSNLSKEERNITIGKLMLKVPGLKSIQYERLEKVRDSFMKENGLIDKDVLSIKKDSFFVFKPVTKLKFYHDFGLMEFKLRNTFSSYYYLGGLEFYLQNDFLSQKIFLTIKGIDSEYNEPFRELMRKYLSYIEMNFKKTMGLRSVREYFRKIRKKYLGLGYDPEIYREFNYTGLFRMKKNLSNNHVYINDIDEENFEEVDISFNYLNFLLPLGLMK